MSQRLHIATRKGLFTFERRGGRWSIARTSFLGDNCTLVMHDPRPVEGARRRRGSQAQGQLVAALDHGHFGVKLHRSRDGGASWQPIGTPAYPPKPADYKPRMPAEGTPYEWALKLVWALVPGGVQQSGRLWCGTLPGGLFHSDDHGQTWEFNRALWDDPKREEWFGGGAEVPGIHSICVHPQNPDHLVLGVSCGGAWITENGGRTWQCGGPGMRAEYMPVERAMDPNIQDPHQIAQCAAHPDTLWVQHHNGIFRSTDRAAHWTEISKVKPSAFGFAVAAHPQDPDTAWFVPAIKDERRIPSGGRVVVNRTTNGGRTFKTLTRGLPQKHAYDLVFRHALDVDETGDRLAFGSTTGSLWLSEDGGDSWKTLSQHLPPIYAVRFEKPNP